jgi:hypothetical protein
VELGLGPVVVVVVVVVVVELLLTAHSFDVWNRPVTYTYILYRATASTRAAQATNHRWQRARSFDGRRRWREKSNGPSRRRSPLEKACPDRSTTGPSVIRSCRNKFQFVVALCVQVVCVAKVLPVVPCISQKQEKNAFACVCVCVCVCDMVTQEKRE